jgi:hypothetical protein
MKCTSVIGVFFFLWLHACAVPPVSKPDTAATHTYDGISLKPGVVAWSPDSTHLVYIKNEDLILVDYASGNNKKISGVKPVFVEWAPGNDLIAVHNTGDRKGLVRVDPYEGTVAPAPLAEEPAAVKWLIPPDELIVLSTQLQRRQIGTFVRFSLTRVTADSHELFFERESYYPTRRQDADFISAWNFPGLRPLHETVLTPQYHNPPAVPPYTYFKTVDPVIPSEEEIARMDSQRFNVPASWSPDGSRLALVNDEGFLIIADTENPDALQPVNYEIQGAFPSWNPRGSQIYLGGWLVGSDGTAIRELLPGALVSLGVWSPDGEKIAVITDSNLLIFDSIVPSFDEPDLAVDPGFLDVREKLRLLKNLLKEELISQPEFDTRKKTLLDKLRGVRK